MRGKRLLAAFDARVLAIGIHLPAIGIVLEAGTENAVDDLPMDRAVLDRYQRFDPSVEIPRHPVGGRYKDLCPPRCKSESGGKCDNPAMFEEPADNTFDHNVF